MVFEITPLWHTTDIYIDYWYHWTTGSSATFTTKSATLCNSGSFCIVLLYNLESCCQFERKLTDTRKIYGISLPNELANVSQTRQVILLQLVQFKMAELQHCQTCSKLAVFLMRNNSWCISDDCSFKTRSSTAQGGACHCNGTAVRRRINRGGNREVCTTLLKLSLKCVRSEIMKGNWCPDRPRKYCFVLFNLWIRKA